MFVAELLHPARLVAQLVAPPRRQYAKAVLDDAKRRMIVQLRWLAMQAKSRRDTRQRRTAAAKGARCSRRHVRLSNMVRVSGSDAPSSLARFAGAADVECRAGRGGGRRR
jgi:hypothetical protein